jgi:hypothetical protein
MKENLWLTLVTCLAYCVDKEHWKAIDYLKEQVRVLKEQQDKDKRILLNDQQRIRLATTAPSFVLASELTGRNHSAYRPTNLCTLRHIRSCRSASRPSHLPQHQTQYPKQIVCSIHDRTPSEVRLRWSGRMPRESVERHHRIVKAGKGLDYPLLPSLEQIQSLCS